MDWFAINLFSLILTLCTDFSFCTEIVDIDSIDKFKIEGRVDLTVAKDKEWLAHTRVLVDGGEYLGYLRNDGTFTINDLPSGSYVVEVAHPEYIFEASRVDITSKGKIRARKVNYLQPSVVKTMTYPFEFKERQKAKYYQTREQWRVTDFLMNPMVLTMVLPLLLIMVLPKLMNAADPEAQKEMQSQMKAFNDKSNMPDVSELLAGLFGSEQKKTKQKAVKKR